MAGNLFLMPTRTLILFLFLFNQACSQTGNKITPRIEIYLVDKVTFIDTLEKKLGFYFSCAASDLPDSAFIKDNEITGYETYKDTSRKYNQGEIYYLHLSKSGQDKLTALKNIPLCCGQRFVITVNREPIYGGYFWNYISSFGCSWLAVPAIARDKLPIERGIPSDYFTKKHSDPRGNKDLIEAFKVSGRLL